MNLVDDRGIPRLVRAGIRADDSRSFRLFRVVAAVILIFATISLATMAFAMNKNKEYHEFHEEYTSYAEQIIEGFRTNFQNTRLAMDSFSIDITSYALGAQLQWPMVTLPDFPIRGRLARQQMKADAIGLLPLVQPADRKGWESYALEGQGWVEYARTWENSRESNPPTEARSLLRRTLQNRQQHSQVAVNETSKKLNIDGRELEEAADFSDGISETIYRVNGDGQPVVDEGNGPFTPIWMSSPAPPTLTNINFNLLSHKYLWQEIEIAVESHQAVISKVLNLESPHESITSTSIKPIEPISAIYYPIFDTYASDRQLVGLLASELKWKHFFEGALPKTATGLICVIENACEQAFTYQIDGPDVTYLGPGDLHDPKFMDMVESRSMSFLTDTNEDFSGVDLTFEPCPFALRIYPSALLEESYRTNEAILISLYIFALFFISASIFLVYDSKNSRKARDDRSVVVLERMFTGEEIKPTITNRIIRSINQARYVQDYTPSAAPAHFRATLKTLPGLGGKGKENEERFSEATVLFADVYGLDAWCAGRETAERSHLLEMVHRTFNLVAKRYGIAQIELTLDSFVAINGAQEAEDEHAAILIHFACDCRKRLIEVFKSLQAKGLAIRFGIHSGHVQSGGFGDEGSRYELFGDTVDTTYQMLSSSRPGKIHVSVETAELLNLAGKGHWLAPRSDLVLVKGKGEMSTFWIKPKACIASSEPKDLLSGSDTSTAASETSSSFDDIDAWECTNLAESQSQEDKLQNVVDRTFAVLLQYLKKVHARRNALRNMGQARIRDGDTELAMGNPIIDEACETVRIPPFNNRAASLVVHSDLMDLSDEVESQLRLYVSSIVSTYRQNGFHNVEHATHVTLTMDQMIKKLASPDDQDIFVDFGGKQRSAESIALDLDGRTFGIASDPLSQFALLFASLVHDVDHVGVSNHQLVKEESPIASLYNNQSVSEQNSVDIAWWLLMTPNFSALRSAIYSNPVEMQRFRQILVNSIIATDIMDRKMKIHRDKVWKKVFTAEASHKLNSTETRNLQGTMLVEHIMQAADHGHTLQTFRTYRKWSQRLFDEMYQAHHSGRAEKDPTKSWYIGELAFFDKFVIPLATRLRDSGAFGSRGDEYLNHALQNRKLWAENGKRLVIEMKEKFSRRVILAQDDMVVFS